MKWSYYTARRFSEGSKRSNDPLQYAFWPALSKWKLMSGQCDSDTDAQLNTVFVSFKSIRYTP